MGSFPPSYNASLSARPSSLPALSAFACINLAMNDRLRMIKFPKEDIDAVRPVIQASWRSISGDRIGIQSEEAYHGSHEFKLKGYPWNPSETLSGACLMAQVIEALYNRGWSMTLSSDLSLTNWIFLSFKSFDEIRVSNLPKDTMEAVTNVVTGYWKIQDQRWKTRPLVPTYGYKIHGTPLAPTGADTVKLHLFFLSLFEVLETFGYTVDSKVRNALNTDTTGMDTIFLKRPLDHAQMVTDKQSLYPSSGSTFPSF